MATATVKSEDGGRLVFAVAYEKAETDKFGVAASEVFDVPHPGEDVEGFVDAYVKDNLADAAAARAAMVAKPAEKVVTVDTKAVVAKPKLDVAVDVPEG